MGRFVIVVTVFVGFVKIFSRQRNILKREDISFFSSNHSYSPVFLNPPHAGHPYGSIISISTSSGPNLGQLPEGGKFLNDFGRQDRRSRAVVLNDGGRRSRGSLRPL